MTESGNTAPARAERLRVVLTDALAPARLDIEDESSRHAGHAGARPGGETHYRVTVVSEKFNGLNRLARARLVHDLLGEEFGAGLHAISLILRSPQDTGT